LTGCDTVAQCFGIGKASAIKALRDRKSLQTLRRTDSSIADVVREATAFIAACYVSCKRDITSMSDARVDVWSTKMSRRNASAAPELKCLPPTTEAFELNVRRAHIQTAI